MIKDANKETVTKILFSAEELFSLYGYHGTAIRELAKKAKVNLAAINYHFGDKQSLYCAVIIRALRPINHTRLDKLTNAVELAGDQLIPLALIIDIFSRPFFQLSDDKTGGRNRLRLIGRSMLEPLPFVDELLAAELHPVTTRFSHVIRRHVPYLMPRNSCGG